MRAQPTAYCFCVFGKRNGPWRSSADDAREDAIEAGFASRDEGAATVYLDVAGEIWVTFDAVEIEARLAPARPAIAAPYPSRIERIIARREGREAA